ncbi:MAG: response regulator [Bacteroidetes bacterium]|nr:response regulator [Bacteroidota bacterium]
MKTTDKICLIDDDEIYIFLMKKSFVAMGVNNEVLSFLNGADAMEELIKLKNNDEILPSIILLDINMPIMDGWEFLKEFRKLHSNISQKIKVYIVSSSIANEDIEKSKTFPEIVDYLTKPVELDTLVSIINE